MIPETARARVTLRLPIPFVVTQSLSPLPTGELWVSASKSISEGIAGVAGVSAQLALAAL
ncbi:hypothetical protein GCM10007901_24270 [Dyella acidisoli]|uniref:Uncharacterized protein n=1 Tax=Dyella acidisoli TaxID=1867834 RepID=A0ABQ5XP16_9GAMM|nr:hypothetical protein GCM10007901_24270 [Dyella acidisoli]